jgi:hypothetical protein
MADERQPAASSTAKVCEKEKEKYKEGFLNCSKRKGQSTAGLGNDILKGRRHSLG